MVSSLVLANTKRGVSLLIVYGDRGELLPPGATRGHSPETPGHADSAAAIPEGCGSVPSGDAPHPLLVGAAIWWAWMPNAEGLADYARAPANCDSFDSALVLTCRFSQPRPLLH